MKLARMDILIGMNVRIVVTKVMKKKCYFTITVGSHWPEKEFPWQVVLPVGGEERRVLVEYETLKGEDDLTEASRALREKMGDVEYHIWYWVFEWG